MDYYLIHMYEMGINAVAAAAISDIHGDESHINNLLYAFATLIGFAHQRITTIRFRLNSRPEWILYFVLAKSNTI